MLFSSTLSKEAKRLASLLYLSFLPCNWALYSVLFIASMLPIQAAEFGVNGLIIDKTFTRFGKEFYRQYSQRLTDQSFEFNLLIEERFLPRTGSVILVSADSRVIFSRILGRRNSELEGHVNTALGATAQFIARRMFPEDNPDFVGDGYR